MRCRLQFSGLDVTLIFIEFDWYLLYITLPKMKTIEADTQFARYFPVYPGMTYMTMDPRMARKLARHRLWSISERSLSCNFAQTEAVRMSQVLCGYPCVTMWHYVLLHLAAWRAWLGTRLYKYICWSYSLCVNISTGFLNGLYGSLQSWRGEAEEAHQLGPEATWYRWQMAPHGAAFSLMRYFADLDIPIKRGTFIEFRQARHGKTESCEKSVIYP